MGRMTVYLGILALLVIGFNFAGYIDNTPISFMLDALLNPETFQTSSFFTELEGILGFFAVGGIIVGAIVGQRIEAAATISFTLLLFLVGWDLIAIFGVLRQLNAMLAIFLVSPMILLYVLTVLEWWRGKD